jgi:UDP-N-acetylglucosamine acyltransferase
MGKIHTTAIVDSRAELDRDVEVGPYSIIGPGVRIGRGTRVKANVVVEGNTTIGEDNIIFQFATVGSVPQDLKYKGEDSRLIIGDRNTIREYVSLNPGTTGGGMVTRVGSHNLLMMYCHIAHDCLLGDYNVIANGATLAGHVTLEDYVIAGGLIGIHQFVKVGTGALIGAGSMVSKDVPPYCNAAGDRARLKGLNIEGMRRRGFKKDQIETIRKAYRIILQSGLTIKAALRKARKELPGLPEVERIANFIENSTRGICR